MGIDTGRAIKTILVLLLTLDVDFPGVFGDAVNDHIEMGKKLLQEGNLADALKHYNMAVSGDPSNYLTYFKRATVYLALGQSKKALPDLGKVVELKPDFHQARLQRANTNLKLGNIDQALADFDLLTKTENSASEEAIAQIERINEAKQARVDAVHLLSVNEIFGAIDRLSIAIEVSPWDLELRRTRAEHHENVGQYQSAISDIKMTTKLLSDNTDAFLRASRLYYKLGDEEDSLKEIRECLKLDPDHKECFPFYKKLKKLAKQLSAASEAVKEGRHLDGIDKLKSALSTVEDEEIFRKRIEAELCSAYSKTSETEEGMKWCDRAHQNDPENLHILCDIAELHINDEDYEEAIKVYQKASGIDNQNQRVKDGLNRAQNLLKQSQKKDYYKILGVKRTATTKEINTAYRRLAKQWHPDKHEGEEKKKAEKMFYDLAAAKEVLSDSEMRQKFDNGEDPLDPEQQHHGHGHGPFPGGFNPFGGGGFTFKFHF